MGVLGSSQIVYLSTLKDIVDQISVGFKDDKQTHRSMCVLGARWLVRKHKCRAVLVERGGAGAEMPDVLGFAFADSYLIEAKESRGDFLSDKKKHFRQKPETGMGKYRWYICPQGLITADELPAGWGLLYVGKGGMIKEITSALPQATHNKDAEYLMLTSALATPWKLFSHWAQSDIEHLSKIGWMSKYTQEEIRNFCARLHANMIDPEEG